ncbi:hypothetical protein S83_008615, partial [Arachis hypogaea]
MPHTLVAGYTCIAITKDAMVVAFTMDVEVVVAQIDLDVVASLRGSVGSFQEQVSCKTKVPSVEVRYSLCLPFNIKHRLSISLKDYLRRSGAFGFLLPLFGGADSSSVAVVVWYMCQLVVKEIANGDEQVKVDAIRIGNYRDGQYPTNSREFAKRIFYTIFMGSENRLRAKVLAYEIGSWHLDLSIDGVVFAFLSLFQTLTGYLSSQRMTPITTTAMEVRGVDRGEDDAGFGEEGERKGERDPVGEVLKCGIKYFILCFKQLDEVDMGMSYEELSIYGRAQKIFRCGPVSMFQ